MRDGFVVIPGAVPRDVTALLRKEIQELWQAPPDGALVEHFRRGRSEYVPPRLDLRAGSTKLLDLHAFSATARRAIAAPAVLELLGAVFEARPKAFQTLTFWRGSQQPIHKDTAYVKVRDEPMHLAASWLALESVTAGAGALQYYVGSHRDPDFLFGGEHKWMIRAPRDHPRYLSSLKTDALRYRHRRERFVAEEGDVLIWHADLAHGGSRIGRQARNEGRTRQSLVTHFTPEHDEPAYQEGLGRIPVEEHGCVFVAEHADIRATGREPVPFDGTPS